MLETIDLIRYDHRILRLKRARGLPSEIDDHIIQAMEDLLKNVEALALSLGRTLTEDEVISVIRVAVISRQNKLRQHHDEMIAVEKHYIAQYLPQKLNSDDIIELIEDYRAEHPEEKFTQSDIIAWFEDQHSGLYDPDMLHEVLADETGEK